MKGSAHAGDRVVLVLHALHRIENDLRELDSDLARPDDYERLTEQLVRGLERRSALTARLPFGLAYHYRRLARDYLSPIGTVVAHRCSACGQAIPSHAEVAGTLVGGFLLCPHCRRILLIQPLPPRRRVQ